MRVPLRTMVAYAAHCSPSHRRVDVTSLSHGTPPRLLLLRNVAVIGCGAHATMKTPFVIFLIDGRAGSRPIGTHIPRYYSHRQPVRSELPLRMTTSVFLSTLTGEEAKKSTVKKHKSNPSLNETYTSWSLSP